MNFCRSKRGALSFLVFSTFLASAGLVLGACSAPQGFVNSESATARLANVAMPPGLDIVAQDFVVDADVPVRWRLPFMGVLGFKTLIEAPPTSWNAGIPTFPRRADVRREVALKVDLRTDAGSGPVDGLNVCLTRSSAMEGSGGTAQGRLLVWKKSHGTLMPRGWFPLAAHGTGGVVVPGRAALLSDVVLNEASSSACFDVASRVNALLPGVSDAKDALIVFDNGLLPDGNKDKLQLMLALRPRGDAFRSGIFSSKSNGQSAFLISTLTDVFPALKTNVLVPRDYASFTSQFGKPARGSTTLGDFPLVAGSALSVQTNAQGIKGFPASPDDSPLDGALGHWQPTLLRFQNDGNTSLSFRLFAFKADLSGDVGAPEFFDAKDVLSFTLPPGETVVDVSNLLENATPRASGGPRYRLVLGIRDAQSAVVFAAFKQGVAGEPVARGVTFPY